jgi:hypothetical protein
LKQQRDTFQAIGKRPGSASAHFTLMRHDSHDHQAKTLPKQEVNGRNAV